MQSPIPLHNIAAMVGGKKIKNCVSIIHRCSTLPLHSWEVVEPPQPHSRSQQLERARPSVLHTVKVLLKIMMSTGTRRPRVSDEILATSVRVCLAQSIGSWELYAVCRSHKQKRRIIISN